MKKRTQSLKRILYELDRRNIPIHAASASFFIILAIFPTLVLFLGLMRYTSIDIYTALTSLDGIVPVALIPAVEKLIFSIYRSSSGAIVSISAVSALWSASRGIYGLLTGLNAIYDVSEDRGFFYTRFISVVYTFLFLLVLIVTLVLHVFGTTLLGALDSATNPLLRFLADVIDLRFFLLVFLQTALFTAMFMVFPNKRNRFWDSLPGALLASIGWLIFSHLFSIFVEYFPHYANVYGSVYAVALCMLWLYFCITIVFYGGALNYFISAKDPD